MATLFYDTSAVVKRYFTEAGSERVDVMLSNNEHGHILSRLGVTEVTSAIMRRASTEAADLLARFENDALVIFGVALLDDALVDVAIDLVKRHRLRGCDSLQLASALRLAAEGESLVFVCADGELNTAAAAEGLAVVDPNDTGQEDQSDV